MDDDHATIAQLAGDLLPALIARLDASDLGELEVRGDGWRIRLRKPFDRRRPPMLAEARRRRGRQPEGAGAAGTGGAGGSGGATAAAVAGSGDGRAGSAAEGAAGASAPGFVAASVVPGAAPGAAAAFAMADASTLADLAALDGADVESAGTLDEGRVVATSPAVGYFAPREGIGVGRQVRAGDIVGYVDCLGVRQEVVAPVDGVLGRTIAQPGEAVEYGQPLVHIGLVAPGAV